MHNWLLICLSVLAALALSLVPMPAWAIWSKPLWVLMILIYWALVQPNQVGMTYAWIVGIIADLLNGTLLGEHALAYTVVLYLVGRIYLRLRIAPFLQQALTIGLFALVYQGIIYCIQGFVGSPPASQWYWSASLTTMILWPWLYFFIRDTERRFTMT